MKGTIIAFEIIGSVVLNWIFQIFTVFYFCFPYIEFSLAWQGPAFAPLSVVIICPPNIQLLKNKSQNRPSDVDTCWCLWCLWVHELKMCLCSCRHVVCVSWDWNAPYTATCFHLASLDCITCCHLAAGYGTSNSDSKWSTFSRSSAHSYLAPFLEIDDWSS